MPTPSPVPSPPIGNVRGAGGDRVPPLHFLHFTRHVARRPALSALLFGALAATGFAPLDLWPALLIGLAALAGLVHAAPTGRPPHTPSGTEGSTS